MDKGEVGRKVCLFAILYRAGLSGKQGEEGAAEADIGGCKGEVGVEEEASKGGSGQEKGDLG